MIIFTNLEIETLFQKVETVLVIEILQLFDHFFRNLKGKCENLADDVFDFVNFVLFVKVKYFIEFDKEMFIDAVELVASEMVLLSLLFHIIFNKQQILDPFI